MHQIVIHQKEENYITELFRCNSKFFLTNNWEMDMLFSCIPDAPEISYKIKHYVDLT